MKSPPTPLVLVKLCCAALAEKKAVDLRVLDISRQSSITDYLVLATGTSDPHLRALRVEIEKVLDAARAHIVGIETAQESGWTVVDTFDVMVHLFTADNRAKYRLESLWKDAIEVSVPALLGMEVSPKAPRSTGRKRPAVPRRKKARSTDK
jgi:ribosome-associated protein